MDLILKKKGKLTYDEKIQIRYHTIYGARLFRRSNSPWDRVAFDVVLNHHERWDGKGYPGKIEDIFAEKVVFGTGKKGEEIPLFARIVALADVYDSLTSKRIYKLPWKNEYALNYIKNQAEHHFDPDLTRMFIDIQDVIKAIKQKYKD